MDVYKDWLGIPEGPRPPDDYQLLRLVKFEDDVQKIEKNYRTLNAHVRKYASGRYSLQSQELLTELAKAMLRLIDLERKRDYDESLGREFEEKPDVLGRKLLEDVLQGQGHMTREQVKEARAFADMRGLSMRDAVVQMKLVDAESATRAYAQELGLSYVDVSEMNPADSVLDELPRSVVKRNSILPLFEDDDMLLVACIHEPTPELEDEIRLRFGIPMKAVLATSLAVNQAIAKHYAPGMRDEAVTDEAAQSSKAGKAAQHKPQEKPLRKRMSQLTSSEATQRRQLGIVIMCWCIALPYLFDQFVLKPLLPIHLAPPHLPHLTTLIVTPTLIWWVLKVYWK